MRVAFCQATFKRDWEATLRHVQSWLPWVDYVVVAVDETVPPEEVEAARRLGEGKLVIKHVEFPESLPAFRNVYVEECKRLGVDWFVVSDPDEWINERTMRDIYALCAEAEEMGYNQLGLNCRERFEPVEWLPFDRLDELKEYPGGYRESSYYKFLINKICCPSFRYEGVGRTKTVHETWFCPAHPRRGAYLPKDRYWYEHVKSAYEIWRNAARNLWLGGGGDNVGDLNEMWVELRRILPFERWREVEEFVESGKPLPPALVDWVKRALVWKATDYGIETREFAKWVIFHHRYLLDDPDIRRGVESPPELTDDDELEAYVRRCYFQVLGRHPDRGGLEYYKEQIKSGRLRREDLPAALRSSQEYRERFALTEQGVRIQPQVNVEIGLRDEHFVQALMRSRRWFEEIKPRLDVGKFVLERVRDREEFLREFYRRRGEWSLEDLLRWAK